MEEMLGLMLLCLAAAYLVALLTASAADPSLNLAVDGPVHNLLGLPGAYIADLMLESLGLACFLLALAPAIWGWQLLRHRPARWWLRLILLPLSVVAASIGLCLIPWASGWPFGGGLGGFAGHLLVDGGGKWRGLAGLAGVPDWWIQIAGLVLALPLSYFALGVSWRRYHQAGQRLAAARRRCGARRRLDVPVLPPPARGSRRISRRALRAGPPAPHGAAPGRQYAGRARAGARRVCGGRRSAA